MDSNMTKMSQILSCLRERYKLMDQFMAFTKEMEKAVDAADGEALGKVLAQRQDVMNRVDKLNLEINKIISELDQPFRGKMRSIIDQKGDATRLDNPMETNIFDTNKRTMQLLQKIRVLDEAVNKKVRGN